MPGVNLQGEAQAQSKVQSVEEDGEGRTNSGLHVLFLHVSTSLTELYHVKHKIA